MKTRKIWCSLDILQQERRPNSHSVLFASFNSKQHEVYTLFCEFVSMGKLSFSSFFLFYSDRFNKEKYTDGRKRKKKKSIQVLFTVRFYIPQPPENCCIFRLNSHCNLQLTRLPCCRFTENAYRRKTAETSAADDDP